MFGSVEIDDEAEDDDEEGAGTTQVVSCRVY